MTVIIVTIFFYNLYYHFQITSGVPVMDSSTATMAVSTSAQEVIFRFNSALPEVEMDFRSTSMETTKDNSVL